jgi:hypothetical protein
MGAEQALDTALDGPLETGFLHITNIAFYSEIMINFA